MFDVFENGINHFSGYPLHLQIALYTIIVCMVLLISITMGIYLRRISEGVYLKKLYDTKNNIGEDLSNFNWHKTFVAGSTQKFADQLSNTYRDSKLLNQVLLDELVFYKRNFTGEVGVLVEDIYKSMDLSKVSIGKIQKSNKYKKAEGLREVHEMSFDMDNMKFIEPLINHRNPDIRVEAQIAYLKLNKENPFGFLENAEQEILVWHQIILMDTIINTPSISPPPLAKFLKSANDSVVVFATKLIEYFVQLEASEDLIALLSKEEVTIKLSALKTLASLNVEVAESAMVGIYHTESKIVKIRILKSLSEINTGRYSYFVWEQFLLTNDFDIAQAACCNLVQSPNFNSSELENKLKELPKFKTEIYKHCTETLSE